MHSHAPQAVLTRDDSFDTGRGGGAGTSTGTYTIETPEQLDLGYDIAGLGSRCQAAMIDALILMVLVTMVSFAGLIGVGVVAGAAFQLSGGDDRAGALLALAVVVLLIFAVIWGYFVFFEMLWNGQTPGKRAMELRVIRDGGYPLTFVASAVRNILRLIDFMPLWYGVGATVMLFDRRSRRLGDLVAGTIVIKDKRDITLASLGLPGVAPPAGVAPNVNPAPGDTPIPNLHRLTPADASLLREYVLRRPTLPASAAAALANRLASVFAAKLEYDLAGEPAEHFIARLAGQAARLRG